MKIMGILNITPDSFSDGGQHFALDQALAQVEQMIDQGVDIIDIGGESTRPFSEEVSLEEELQRVIPVIEGIRNTSSIAISIDTYKAEVARQALESGADIINDISALEDPGMAGVVREHNCPIIIMHMQGNPHTMQIQPHYNDVVGEIYRFFADKISILRGQGIAKEQIIIDPGIGFGKTLDHNLSLIKHLSTFKKLDCPVLLGHSRKRFIGEVTGEKVENRDFSTALIAAFSLFQGVDIVRVHDVGTTSQALKLAEAIFLAR